MPGLEPDPEREALELEWWGIQGRTLVPALRKQVSGFEAAVARARSARQQLSPELGQGETTRW